MVTCELGSGLGSQNMGQSDEVWTTEVGKRCQVNPCPRYQLQFKVVLPVPLLERSSGGVLCGVIPRTGHGIQETGSFERSRGTKPMNQEQNVFQVERGWINSEVDHGAGCRISRICSRAQ
jgi:hypothetical protein